MDRSDVDNGSSLYPDVRLPLPAYIIEAGKSEQTWMDQEYSAAGHEADWKCGWHFVRLMKGYPALRVLDADSALAVVFPLVMRIARSRASDSDGTSISDAVHELTGCEEYDFEATFIHCWVAIRILPGESPIVTAERLAKANPLIPDRCGGGRLPLYARIVSIAGWLQRVVGDQPIHLATRMLGQLVGCSARSAAAYLKMAQEDGFLTLERRMEKAPKAESW